MKRRMTVRLIQPDFIEDGAVIGLWHCGCDTFEIAKRLHVRESQIANRLAQLRDAEAA